MKGIREMAMGTEPEEPEYLPSYPPYKPPTYPSYESGSLFGGGRKSKLNDDLPEVVDPTTGESSYYQGDYHAPGEIRVTIYIDREAVGEIADPSSKNYDWQRADALATEIGYDKLEELLGKSYESKYQISFSSVEAVDDYEVTATLIPV